MDKSKSARFCIKAHTFVFSSATPSLCSAMNNAHAVGVHVLDFEVEASSYARGFFNARRATIGVDDAIRIIHNVFNMNNLAAHVSGRCFQARDGQGEEVYVIDQIESYAGDKDHVLVRWLSWEASEKGHVTVEPLKSLPVSCARVFLDRVALIGAADLEVDEVNAFLGTPASFLEASVQFPRMCRAEEVWIDEVLSKGGYRARDVYCETARVCRDGVRKITVEQLVPRRELVCPGAPMKCMRARVSSEAFGTRSGKVRRTVQLE